LFSELKSLVATHWGPHHLLRQVHKFPHEQGYRKIPALPLGARPGHSRR
jgi:hypothetical protein